MRRQLKAQKQKTCIVPVNIGIGTRKKLDIMAREKFEGNRSWAVEELIKAAYKKFPGRNAQRRPLG